MKKVVDGRDQHGHDGLVPAASARIREFTLGLSYAIVRGFHGREYGMNDPILHLIAAMASFLILHFVLSSPSLRGPTVGAAGERVFLALYSLIAIATLGWAGHAFAVAPEITLWPVPTGVRHLTGAVMLVACIFFFCAVTTRSPTAVNLDDKGGELPVPGIARVTRHPMMWGIGLWAIMHAVANGDLASVIFFGGLAVLALLGPRMIDHRRALAMGERWQRFAEQTSYVPFAAILAGRTRVTPVEIGLWRIFGGMVVYAVLLFLHEPVFGIWPLWVG